MTRGIAYKINADSKSVTVNYQEFTKYRNITVTSKEISPPNYPQTADPITQTQYIYNEGSGKITYQKLTGNYLPNGNMEVVSKELNIFLSRDYIITVYKEELDIISGLIGDIEESKNTFILKEKPNASIVLYYILDRIILRNYEVISSIEAHADKIEISILKSPRNEHLEELIHLRRQVYKIRKYLNPLRYIGDGLISNENYIIETENIGYFKKLSTKIEKLMLSLESLVQDLALVREAFESEISNKTNELMKVFTLIASIFLPLNLITSMYGMNFKNIPFVELEHGYYIVTIIMLTISFGLLVLFKKKKWL
jgi:magnesium transporter